MNRFNLSEWALRHRSLVAYFMLMIVVAGVASYLTLGRSEDPDFTVKTMVVQAGWPGATVEDTLQQVTDRLERKLQETPSLDYLKSYTSAGRDHDLRQPEGLDAGRPSAGHLVPGAQEGAATSADTLPQGIVGPGFNDEFGDTFGIVYGFTADGFTERELHDYVRRRPQAAAPAAGHLQDRRHGRAGRAHLRRVLDRADRRASGSTAPR